MKRPFRLDKSGYASQIKLDIINKYAAALVPAVEV